MGKNFRFWPGRRSVGIDHFVRQSDCWGKQCSYHAKHRGCRLTGINIHRVSAIVAALGFALAGPRSPGRFTIQPGPFHGGLYIDQNPDPGDSGGRRSFKGVIFVGLVMGHYMRRTDCFGRYRQRRRGSGHCVIICSSDRKAFLDMKYDEGTRMNKWAKPDCYYYW
jgi:hypothetical protein